MTQRRERRLGRAVGLWVVLAFSMVTWATGPAGEPRTLDSEVKKPLRQALDSRDYIAGSGRHALNVAIKAFLWDQRSRLVDPAVPEQREVDLAVCLLADEFSRLQKFTQDEPMVSWCREQLSVPPGG